MGIDISNIVKTDFRQVEDRFASEEYAKKTIELLKKNLFIKGADDYFVFEYMEYSNETSIEIPVYDIYMILHNGFWQIETSFHYCQLLIHSGNYLHLRRMVFDITRALGQEEAWHATEHYSDNGGGCDVSDISFEQWMAGALKQYGKEIPEFDQQWLIAQKEYIPDYEPIYHDSFTECKQLFDSLQSRLGKYRLLGLTRFGDCYLRCEKDGKLYLVSEFSLRPLFNEPIDGILNYWLNNDFIVIKNGLSAVVNSSGHLLTDFVKGQFEWKRGNRGNITFINKEAGIELER